MLKKAFTFLFVFVFAVSFSFAQSQFVEHKKKIVDPNAELPVSQNTKEAGKNFFNNSIYNVGESIGITTDYDYYSNSIVRDQIVYHGGTPHFMVMARGFDPNNPATRIIVYSYKDGANWTYVPPFGLTAGGWPQVDVMLTGSAVGTLVMVGHAPSRLGIYDGAGSFVLSAFDNFTDPSVQTSGDNIYLATSGNRIQFQFYSSLDFGVSFTNWDSISSFSPDPIFWMANGGVEVDMAKSPNEQYLVMAGTNANGGHMIDGVPADSADNAWIILSEDGGTSWTGQVIGRDGDVAAVSGYDFNGNTALPLFENFGQVHVAVDNNGKVHAVANGYGFLYNPTTDSVTGNVFNVLYWNSDMTSWVSISDVNVDTDQNIASFYPGNGIGQSYPQVSTSPNGDVVYATWTGPQYTAGVLDTANGVYFTDLYHAFSVDGGATWTYGGVYVGEKNVSETFGHAANHLEDLGNGTYRAHINYMADLEPGVFVFAEGPASQNPFMYTTYDIVGTNVDDNAGLVNNFNLEQNYPNPFNPTTIIKYTLAEKSNVTIKVYDVLGKEVATLVNTTVEAGTHSVNFDASKLSSGMYVYTINAGEFTSSKKMMLMK